MSHAEIESAGAGKGSYRSYAIGFILSIGLTVISFALVMSGGLSRQVILLGILEAAVLQILVHLHYFLHLDSSSRMRWNVMVLIYTVMLMIIFVGGSIWIMHSTSYRMM
jgi:cytochrome o ubiquinol oxidase subunit IV